MKAHRKFISFTAAMVLASCSCTGEVNAMFKNLFSSKDKIDFNSTDKMMDEAEYWRIISVFTPGMDEKGYLEGVTGKLRKLMPDEIVGFRLRTDYLMYISYRQDLWCAAYIVNGGCSDDGFEYFRLWLISQGELVFNDVLVNPDNLVKYVSGDNGEYELESLWYVASTAFFENTGKALNDYISPGFQYGAGNYPDLKFTWREDDPESMRKICPELMKRYRK